MLETGARLTGVSLFGLHGFPEVTAISNDKSLWPGLPVMWEQSGQRQMCDVATFSLKCSAAFAVPLPSATRFFV